MNGIDFFDRGCMLNPAARCLVDAQTGQGLSYAEVQDQTWRIGNALRRHGYGPDTRSAVWCGNVVEGVVTVLSVIRAGSAWVPVNIRNTIEQNIDSLVAFDCDLAFVHADHADAIPALRARAPRIRQVIVIAPPGDARPVPAGAVALADWIAPADDTPFDLPHAPQRLYSLVASTGTSGRPKGIMTPTRAVEAMTANLLASMPCDAPPVFLAVSPISHASGGFMHYFFAQGGTLVLYRGGPAASILRAIRDHRVSHSFLAPTVIYDLLGEADPEGADYTSLRCIFYGGAPAAPAKIRAAIERFGPVFAQVYGQVEVGGGAAILLPGDHMQDGQVAPDTRLACSGRAMPFVRIEIMADDDSGRLLPPGELGEIVLRGQGVMLGYAGDPEASAHIGAHGWHHSQDIGYKDAEGFIYVVDRKRDMIISGGFNIYSVEVENAALQHPAVMQCAAIGVPDDRWGEAVKLIVRPVPGASVDAATLIAHCRALIGSVKAPKTVEFRDALPHNSAGKILKYQLREAHLRAVASPPTS